MKGGIYSRLVEARRLAEQLERKMDLISQHAPAAIAAELLEVAPKMHAVKSRLIGAVLRAKEDLDQQVGGGEIEVPIPIERSSSDE